MNRYYPHEHMQPAGGARRGELGYCETFSPMLANVSKQTTKPINFTGGNRLPRSVRPLPPSTSTPKGDKSTFHKHECCPCSLSLEGHQRVAATEAPGARHLSAHLARIHTYMKAGGLGAPLGCIPLPGPQVTAQRVSLSLKLGLVTS
jgi:hypothetical protein